MSQGSADSSADLASEFSTSLVDLLARGRFSLAVSTYQAGQLVLVRQDGEAINTHFCAFQRPMGLAFQGQRLAVGTACQVAEFRNTPAVTKQLEPAGKFDACFIPRSVHYTGNIDIHEIGFAGTDLWLVNTRFSCLCTLDSEHSFVPRWRPPWVSGYSVDDRCHLNGLAIVDQRPRYVTALAQTDSAEGWRSKRGDGGVLFNLETERVQIDGLSMPHSPRWYRGRLWFLESGTGSLCFCSPDDNNWQRLAQLPGFTRGLDFFGRYAFVGLSQVRETAVFDGLPITRKNQERRSGVWVVDIESGETVALLRFSGQVQEVFSVCVLPGIRFPALLDSSDPLVGSSFVLPDAALKEVAPATG
jgi:uncharacterized protein (TIGR03032 family)